MKGLCVTAVILAVFSAPRPGKAQERGDVPRLPGAELLVETYQRDRAVLLLATEEKTLTLQEYAISLMRSPSISADGNIVASTRWNEASTYSVKEGKWTSHPELKDVWGSVAISPDGSKLACVTRDQLGAQDSPRIRLQILDLGTGKVTVATKPWEHPGPNGVSWSPDGRRIVFEMQVPGFPSSGLYAISVLDVETGAISQIGLGQSPSWSPSGEWIAYAGYVERNQSEPGWSPLYAGRYYSESEHQFNLMGPNGTHSRVLMGFRSGVSDNAVPVWSPDSKELLLTRVHDPDKGTFDIYVFDLATHKLTKAFRQTTASVYGWAEAK